MIIVIVHFVEGRFSLSAGIYISLAIVLPGCYRGWKGVAPAVAPADFSGINKDGTLFPCSLSIVSRRSYAQINC